MKNIILFIILLLYCEDIFPQTFHCFLFCNTNEKDIGKGVEKNYSLVKRTIPKIAKVIDYKPVLHSIIGEQFNNHLSLQILDTCQFQNDDIVLIYFNSHGLRSYEEQSFFPRIKMGNGYKSIEDIYSNFKKNKKVKSVMMLIDACNSYQKNFTPLFPLIEPIESEDIENITYTGTQENNIKTLFSSSCNFIITAGDVGQYAWTSDNGSVFTSTFFNTFNQYIKRTDVTFSWENFMELCHINTVHSIIDIRKPIQSPIWDTDNCFKNFDIETDTLSPTPILKVRITSNPNSYITAYALKVEIGGSKKLLNSIEKVKYILHENHITPTIESYNKEERFRHLFYAFYSFSLKAEIFYTDGKSEILEKSIILSKTR